MKGCCSYTKKGHSHGTLPNDPQRHPPQGSFLNLGIYIDESHVKAGSLTKITSDAPEPEILFETTSEITFLNDRVILGEHQNRNYSHENNFRIYDLIKEASTPIQVIRVNAMFLTLTKEEILAIFFEKLFGLIKMKKSLKSIDNVVITLPFHVTSLEKEKIKLATQAAGILQVRICSSVMTTAIAYAHENDWFGGRIKQVETLFVAEYTRTGFSMAIIDVGPDFVVAQKSLTSANLEECQEREFIESHAAMFENRLIKSEKTYSVFKTYSKAVNLLCGSKEVLLNNCEPLIVKKEEKRALLDQNFVSIFKKDIQCSLVNSGPLAGACLLASRFLLASAIPFGAIVCESSATNLVWTNGEILGTGGGKLEKVGNFCPGVVFEAQVALSCGKDNIVILEEQGLAAEGSNVVGHYRVNVDRVNSNSVKVKLLCRTDQNGIFGVGFVFPNGVFGNAVRTSGPSISSYNSSGYNTLRSFYQLLETIAAKQALNNNNNNNT